MNFDWDTFTYDETWLRQAVQAEVESGCDIQVGGKPAIASTVRSPQLQAQLHKVKILSILFNELHVLLQQADLGSATEAAFVRGRQLIQVQLSQLSSEHQAYFEALVVEDATTSENHPLRSQLTHVLCRLLSPADWQEIAQAAMGSLQSHLLEQVSLQRSA